MRFDLGTDIHGPSAGGVPQKISSNPRESQGQFSTGPTTAFIGPIVGVEDLFVQWRITESIYS